MNDKLEKYVKILAALGTIILVVKELLEKKRTDASGEGQTQK